MSIQYIDKSFSENISFDQALERFMKPEDEPKLPMALFRGTENQLDAIKAEADVEGRIAKIEDQLKQIKSLKSDNIIILTDREIKNVCSCTRGNRI